MSDELVGLRIVITGGGAGIGRATALMASQRGAAVAIADRDEAAARAVVEEVSASGARAFPVACDVTSAESVRAAMAQAQEGMGGIDVLHCNAGITDAIAAQDSSVEGLDIASWDLVYAVNVRGIFLCTQAALPALKQSARASVITAASIASAHARPRTLAYASSKAAVVMLTKSLALELAPHGVRVNGYNPGMVRTEMAERYLAAAADPDELLGKVLENYLTNDIGAPQDVAEVVCFLASERSRFINGAVIDVDGGFGAFKATGAERGIEQRGEEGGSA